MAGLENREKAFEDMFAHDAGMKFKAEARRNRKVAIWAAAQLGLTGAAVDDYVRAVRKADLAESGDVDVLAKLAADFRAGGVPIADIELKAMMDRCLAEAVTEMARGD